MDNTRVFLVCISSYERYLSSLVSGIFLVQRPFYVILSLFHASQMLYLSAEYLVCVTGVQTSASGASIIVHLWLSCSAAVILANWYSRPITANFIIMCFKSLNSSRRSIDKCRRTYNNVMYCSWDHQNLKSCNVLDCGSIIIYNHVMYWIVGASKLVIMLAIVFQIPRYMQLWYEMLFSGLRDLQSSAKVCSKVSLCITARRRSLLGRPLRSAPLYLVGDRKYDCWLLPIFKACFNYHY